MFYSILTIMSMNYYILFFIDEDMGIIERLSKLPRSYAIKRWSQDLTPRTN